MREQTNQRMSANKNERMKEKERERKIGLMLDLQCERERQIELYTVIERVYENVFPWKPVF